MIDTSGWKEFLLADYFDIVPGKYYYPDEYEDGTTPYVSASNENNGIGQHINLSPDFDGNCIVTGKVGCTAFYEAQPFCATSDVNVFKPKFDMTPAIGMFIVTVINYNENYKWVYGRQCRVGNSKRISILLPATLSGDPDWQYMEDFMKKLNCEPVTTSVKSSHLPLETEKWGEFRVGDLFDLRPTKGVDSTELIEGNDVSYIGAKKSDNGFVMRCQLDGFEDWVSQGNCIVFICLGAGSAGFATYQGEDFIGMSGKTLCGYNPKLNELNGNFIATVLCCERLKYSFGRSWTGNRLKNTIIKLPVTPSGEPDWEWMENYMRSLPYSDKIADVSQ